MAPDITLLSVRLRRAPPVPRSGASPSSAPGGRHRGRDGPGDRPGPRRGATGGEPVTTCWWRPRPGPRRRGRRRRRRAPCPAPGGDARPRHSPSSPVGAVVRHPILAGEPVVAARLAPPGLAGAAALGRPGRPGGGGAAGPVGYAAARGRRRGRRAGRVPPGADERRATRPAFPLVERATVVDVGDEADRGGRARGRRRRVACAVRRLALAGVAAGLRRPLAGRSLISGSRWRAAAGSRSPAPGGRARTGGTSGCGSA